MGEIYCILFASRKHGKKRVSETYLKKLLVQNPGRAIVHILRQHLEYVSPSRRKIITFGLQGKLRSIVWTISGK